MPYLEIEIQDLLLDDDYVDCAVEVEYSFWHEEFAIRDIKVGPVCPPWGRRSEQTASRRAPTEAERAAIIWQITATETQRIYEAINDDAAERRAA